MTRQRRQHAQRLERDQQVLRVLRLGEIQRRVNDGKLPVRRACAFGDEIIVCVTRWQPRRRIFFGFPLRDERSSGLATKRGWAAQESFAEPWSPRLEIAGAAARRNRPRREHDCFKHSSSAAQLRKFSRKGLCRSAVHLLWHSTVRSFPGHSSSLFLDSYFTVELWIFALP